jgi:hypothetical protein
MHRHGKSDRCGIPMLSKMGWECPIGHDVTTRVAANPELNLKESQHDALSI